MNLPIKETQLPQATWRRRLINRRILNPYTFVLAVALLAFGGYFGWLKWQAYSNRLAQYQIVKVQRGDIDDLVIATGTMQPRDYVDVGAQVSGQLKKIHVEIGSQVRAGDLLGEIDPTVFRANVEARRALLRNQQATLMDKESQFTLAQLQLNRQKNLMAGDATTADSLQSAEAVARSAKAQIDALQAQIEQTRSTLQADEANLNYAKIYAPIDGVVVSITARQGQTLNANQQAPTILRIADLSTMTVQTQVSEADIGQLRPDMDVYFTTLGGRGKRWYGKLRKVEPTPTVSNNVVLYNALFDVANTQRSLLPQMTAQVFFVAASARDVLLAPASAVTLRRGNHSGVANSVAAPKGAATDGLAEKRATPAKSATLADNKDKGNRDDAQKRQRREQARQSAADSDRTSDTVPTGAVWAGMSAQRPRGPREATVKVVTADGEIEERTVQVGIANRVHMEILSGLSEGEQVIIGVKQQPPVQRASQDGARNTLQQNQGPGAGNAGGGAGRSR
jgi:macrolide-specific efflux system membrane fusion protein